jgi:hypothetical protein
MAEAEEPGRTLTARDGGMRLARKSQSDVPDLTATRRGVGGTARPLQEEKAP